MSRPAGLWVLGAGGHAKVVIAAAESAGFRIVGVLDDAAERIGTTVLGHRVTGVTKDFDPGQEDLAVVAIGDNLTRQCVAARFPGTVWATIVDAHASVHASVALGPGTVVFAGAVVQPDTVIGAHVILNTACSVDHDGNIGDAVHVGPGARVAGNVSCDEGALIGIGAAIVPGRRVGSWSTVGAGATVLEDVPGGVVVVGTPARALASSARRASTGGGSAT